MLIQRLAVLVFAVAGLLSAPALAIEEAELWAAVKAAWGEDAKATNVRMVQDDATCDGTPDYIVSRLNLQDPNEAFFEVLVITSTEKGIKTESIRLPFTGAEEEFGLCGTPNVDPTPEISVDGPWSKVNIALFVRKDVCETPLTVSNGICTPVRFFWNRNQSSGEPVFAFYRE